MVWDPLFWKGRRIFVTGHTGFKGSWLCLWLNSLGCVVTGYALEPPTHPSLFELCRIDNLVDSFIADVRDGEKLVSLMADASPEIIIHMAAQPLVRDSYEYPVETYSTNVMGTVNLFEAVRKTPEVRAIINVTTDKCYENRELARGYREDEPLGGYDPYSSSKACSEIVTAAYRQSFFNPDDYNRHGVAVATARAGNVIGGGDWARDRLIPDMLRAFEKGQKIQIRSPNAIRPWQHVLESLSGYLTLGRRLFEDGPRFGRAWNFGPDERDERPVAEVVKKLCAGWEDSPGYELDKGEHPHEAGYLKLDSSIARSELGWSPVWDLDTALEKVVDWNRIYWQGGDVRRLCEEQIGQYAEQLKGGSGDE